MNLHSNMHVHATLVNPVGSECMRIGINIAIEKARAVIKPPCLLSRNTICCNLLGCIVVTNSKSIRVKEGVASERYYEFVSVDQMDRLRIRI